MRAAVGDRLLVPGHYEDQVRRHARILEVRGEAGSPPYLVRWIDDGHVGLLFPGPDAIIEAAHADAPVADGGEATHPTDDGVIRVRHQHGDAFIVSMRGHELVVDQPVALGGGDAGPTPTELFVASVGSCAAFFARRYLDRHHLAQGLEVTVRHVLSHDRPARVERIDLVLHTDAPLPDQRRSALRRTVEHCTVSNSLRSAPDIIITLSDAQGLHAGDEVVALGRRPPDVGSMGEPAGVSGV
jgi:putative redox protein